MNPEDRRRILSNYLGYLLEKPSLLVRERLTAVKAEGRNLVCLGGLNPSKGFKEVITYLAVKDGRKNLKVLSSTQVIDIHLGKDESVVTYRDLVDPALFVTVWKGEMENKRRWELLYQLSIERINMGRGITIITEVINKSELEQFIGLEFTLIDLSPHKPSARSRNSLNSGEVF